MIAFSGMEVTIKILRNAYELLIKNRDILLFIGGIMIKKFQDVCDDLKVIVTCRTGEEEVETKKDREMIRFVTLFDRIELEDISLNEGKTIAENVEIDFSESEFDCTIGSVLLGLNDMKVRYENLHEEEKVFLRLMTILVEGETYSIEKSVLKELFHHWIDYERINADRSFDSCLERLVRDSFLVDLSGFVSPSYYPSRGC